MIKIALYSGRICECGLKTTSFKFGNVFLCQKCIQLAGLIEKALPRIGPRIEALTFTSPALNLQVDLGS